MIMTLAREEVMRNFVRLSFDKRDAGSLKSCLDTLQGLVGAVFYDHWRASDSVQEWLTGMMLIIIPLLRHISYIKGR